MIIPGKNENIENSNNWFDTSLQLLQLEWRILVKWLLRDLHFAKYFQILDDFLENIHIVVCIRIVLMITVLFCAVLHCMRKDHFIIVVRCFEKDILVMIFF